MRMRVFQTLIFLIMLAAFAFPAQAETKIITKTIRQSFEGMQSPEDARITAVTRAKRMALEEAGTYLESLTVVQNGSLAQDQIMALAAGVLKTEIIQEKRYVTDDTFGIEVTARINVDTSILDRRVREFLDNAGALQKFEESEKKQQELLARIEELETKNRELTKLSTEQREELKEEFKHVSQGLTAEEWTHKAFALWDNGRYTDPQKALEYLNQAIELDPQYGIAYNDRGNVHNNFSQYKRAIADYGRAIDLTPGFGEAYYNRGVTYATLQRHSRAITDFSQAIKLNPNYTKAYYNRGVVYATLGQYQRAIWDYDRAIELNPNYAFAYGNRAFMHKALGNILQAKSDANRARLINFNIPVPTF
ncbi:tetratricopeptide repeat protein [Desulfovibrio ferrophilus]|uniref:Tetratricopeptide repeat protein n=1 Tax=Desulfovibrio ferrophilus TaxID=241368 RepID=A0A2Z6AZN8_9BACT|nr:tetratricopeptide repeat protein [Desulfovibrio ferrophilus]BBD08737.1 tetratricopeptide repeat protein [Desulfovibrio ferrophilus]